MANNNQLSYQTATIDPTIAGYAARDPGFALGLLLGRGWVENYNERGIRKLQDSLKGKDGLETWLRKLNPQVICSNEQIIIDAYSKVLEYAYSLDSIISSAKDDWFRTKDIADPWLIAAAMAYNGKIVTNETDIRPNARKRLIIPNIASYFSVECIKAPQMMKELNMVI